jgi:selenocysteine-specific elongation factor
VQIDSAVEVLAAAGELERLESVAIAAVVWQASTAAVAAAVDACHREFPERAGPALTELSLQVAEVLRAPDLFRSLVVSLCDRGFVQDGNVLRRAAHVAELPEALARASEKIRETLDESPFEPPARKELLQLPKAPEIVRFMIESGDAVQIGPELVMSGTAYAEAIVRVRAHIEANGPATVSDLKGAIGTTRRVMVPLAEKMDRDRVTVRVGDKRKIL